MPGIPGLDRFWGRAMLREPPGCQRPFLAWPHDPALSFLPCGTQRDRLSHLLSTTGCGESIHWVLSKGNFVPKFVFVWYACYSNWHNLMKWNENWWKVGATQKEPSFLWKPLEGLHKGKLLSDWIKMRQLWKIGEEAWDCGQLPDSVFARLP